MEGRPSWPSIRTNQDGVPLIREMHALHHLQDGARPGMWEIVLQDRNLMLCTQKQDQSNTEYLWVFQGATDAIDKAGRATWVNSWAIEVVCSERKIRFAGIKIYKVQKQAVVKESKNLYLAATAFAELYNGTHTNVKRTVRNDWIMHRGDTLPINILAVGRLAASYQEPTAANRPAVCDPKHPRVALVEANSTQCRKGHG